MDDFIHPLTLEIPESLENLQLPSPELLSYYTDIQKRIIWIDFEIDDRVSLVIKKIIQWNYEDSEIPKEKRKPIVLFINSPGGDIINGFSLIDTIMTSETEVWTVNIGMAYSMSFLILLASEKRMGYKNSSYLLHDGNYTVTNSGLKVKDFMGFNQQIEERIKNFVVSRTSITSEMYDEKMRYEWYMYADEALSLNVIQDIVTTNNIFSLTNQSKVLNTSKSGYFEDGE